MTELDPVRRVADLFDQVADTYENVDVDFFTQIGRSVLERQIPVEGERWLDVGCGRGAVLLPVAERIGPAGSIVGVDISTNMLERTAADARERGLTNVTLLHGDAQELPVTAADFDSVSSCLVIFFVPDPVRALKSMHRALRPDGRIVITTFGSPDPRWADVDAVLRPHMPQPRPGVTEKPAESPFASDAGVEGLMHAADFRDVRTELIELPIHFDSIERWFDFSWSHGQRAMWLSVAESERAELRARLTDELERIASTDGSLVYHQKVRHTLAVR